MKQRISFTVLCFVLMSFVIASVSAQTCINNRKNFIPNSTYDANRRFILSSLPSNAVAQGGFYSGSFGQEPDVVYAVGMCLPGADATDCSTCIKRASDWLIFDCQNQTDAYYWALDPTNCLVRYSDASFSGSAAFWDTVPQYLVLNTANIDPNITDFKKIWDKLILSIIDAASTAKNKPSSSNNHYKAAVAPLTKFQNIYALMQCTPDISPGDCDNCLRQNVMDYQSCCMKNSGGYVMRPICFFRWQLFTFSKAFGNITVDPPPSPPPSSPPTLQRQSPSSGNQSQRTDTIRKNNSTGAIVAIVVAAVVVVGILIIAFIVLIRRRSARKGKSDKQVELNQESDQPFELNQTGVSTVRSLQFDFKTIEAATDNFSADNHIGQGGFGDVFKGTLSNGKKIAVKRLKRTTPSQGEREFKNEVVVVATLQHKNLVRLLGFSVKGEERMLVYEFVPNKSLNHYLSDPKRQRQLDWKKRYTIIKGITKGILYLHQDSHLKVIHRDIKADNVLLDADMNAKICDFGTARIFGMDQTSSNTGKIIGTEGYMPPEYRTDGWFSAKSDVFSFGVLVLEIICGNKHTDFRSPRPNLVTYAWRLWRDQTPMELLDESITENIPTEEVTRCIHIALLCVQHEPTDRPDMSEVMSMLTGTKDILHVPEQPGFFILDTPVRSNSQTINSGT